MKKVSILTALAVAMTLGACESKQNAVAPSVSGQPPATQPATPLAGAPVQPLPYQALDTSNASTPTGTLVGERVNQFRAALTRLQASTAEQIQRHQQLRADSEANA